MDNKVKTDEPKVISDLRDILINGPKRVNGYKVDSYTASAITQVYDALLKDRPDLAAKYATFSIRKMQEFAFKYVK